MKGRRKIDADDLVLLRQIWKDKLLSDRSFFVDKETIAANEYKLSMNNYMKRRQPLKTVKLKELVKDGEIIIGFTPPRDDDFYWFGGKNLWVAISDMGDDMYISDTEEKITDAAVKPNKVLPTGTLLFSFKLSIGKVAITKKPVCTNEAIAGLIVEDEVIRKYLYYILPKLDYNTNRAAKGDTLNKDTVGDLEIPFEINTVKRIVAALDKIEAERQKTIVLKTKLEDKKDSLILDKVLGDLV